MAFQVSAADNPKELYDRHTLGGIQFGYREEESLGGSAGVCVGGTGGFGR